MFGLKCTKNVCLYVVKVSLSPAQTFYISIWLYFFRKGLTTMKDWLVSIGLREDLIDFDVHARESLAHYARACTDITFTFPFGKQELLGVAARGCYDLKAHMESSGKSLEYFDEETKNKFIPHVIEPSCGVDRLFLALIISAYAEDEVGGEKRKILKFHPSIAPIKVAVFPLVKNKPAIVKKSRDIFLNLQKRYNVAWDTSGAIGRRTVAPMKLGPFVLQLTSNLLKTTVSLCAIVTPRNKNVSLFLTCTRFSEKKSMDFRIPLDMLRNKAILKVLNISMT